MTTQMRRYHLLSFYFSTEKLLCGQCNTGDRGVALMAGDPLPVSVLPLASIQPAITKGVFRYILLARGIAGKVEQ